MLLLLVQQEELVKVLQKFLQKMEQISLLLMFLLMKKLKLLKKGDRASGYVSDLQLDASDPKGMSKRAEESLTAFSQVG